MQNIFLDFETYYDKEYSLRKMTPVEYVLDPRFEAIGCAVREGVDGKDYWVDGVDLQKFFDGLNPDVTSLVTFNALFDMCVTAWRFNFVPRLMIDMLGVARATLAHRLRRLPLSQVALHLGIGVKGDTVHKVVGMNSAAIRAAGIYDSYVDYSLNDNDLCAQAFKKLVLEGGFPASEIAVMDMVLRCAIQPSFILDRNVLALHAHEVKREKDELLTQAMLVGASGKPDLMSNEKFAEMLRNLGVEPPMKISRITGQPAYAFAKTDPEFLALEEHENPAVQALFAARVGHKTTIEETRTDRLVSISNLTWPGKGQAALMPVPLNYGAAHTHRLGGTWKLNMQNLPRGGSLRRALTAPPGHKVVTVDASQIEARLAPWLCGEWQLVDQFARGEDVYCIFASDVFGFVVTKNNKPERFVGKQGILGLQFGVGAPKFQNAVKVLSKAQTGSLIELSDEEALKVVTTYRRKYSNIPKGWRTLNTVGIQTLALGGKFDFGPCHFEKGTITLPNGLQLFYHNLRNEDGEWRFEYGGVPKKLYGAKVLENLCQSLSRVHTFDAAVRIQKRVEGITRLALQAHDELVYVVPDQAVDKVKEIALEEMIRRPWWAPTLPLAAEAGVGQNYGEAK